MRMIAGSGFGVAVYLPLPMILSRVDLAWAKGIREVVRGDDE
jgi:hypothetical protein